MTLLAYAPVIFLRRPRRGPSTLHSFGTWYCASSNIDGSAFERPIRCPRVAKLRQSRIRSPRFTPQKQEDTEKSGQPRDFLGFCRSMSRHRGHADLQCRACRCVSERTSLSVHSKSQRAGWLSAAVTIRDLPSALPTCTLLPGASHRAAWAWFPRGKLNAILQGLDAPKADQS